MGLLKTEELTNEKEALKIGAVGKSNSNQRVREITKLESGRNVLKGKADDAANDIDNDFGSWGLAAQSLFAGHLLWLLKDMFWILLIPYPAWTFGILTTFAFVFAIALRAKGGAVAQFYQEAPVELMVGLIQLSWQIFNVALMIVDFMYAVPDRVPEYAESMVLLSDCASEDECEEDYNTWAWIARVGFILAFLIWVVFTIFLVYKYFTPPNYLYEGYALQTCLLQGGWVAFWILKDFFWTFDNESGPYEPFVIIAWTIHFVLLCIWLVTHTSPLILIDGIDEAEMKQIEKHLGRMVDRTAISYVFWSIASLLWFICEDLADGELALRYVAAGLCVVSFFLFASAYWQVKAKSRANDIFIKKLRAGSVGAWQEGAQVVGVSAVVSLGDERQDPS